MPPKKLNDKVLSAQHFQIPASNSDGESILAPTFRLPPELLMQIKEMFAKKGEKFGWRTEADMMRACVAVGFEALKEVSGYLLWDEISDQLRTTRALYTLGMRRRAVTETMRGIDAAIENFLMKGDGDGAMTAVALGMKYISHIKDPVKRVEEQEKFRERWGGRVMMLGEGIEEEDDE